MEEGRGQTDCQVGGGHLVLADAGRHVAQQAQQRPQRLAVLVGQQQHGGAHRLQTEFFRHVWRGRRRMPWLGLALSVEKSKTNNQCRAALCHLFFFCVCLLVEFE